MTLATSCDTIPESERFIAIAPVSVKRCVLVEEFTGQRCINCPKAAAYVDELQSQYTPDTVIAVAIHAGELAVYSTQHVVGLRTPLGDTYYKANHIEALPYATINRKGGSSVLNRWGTAVHDALSRQAPLALSAVCNYHSAPQRVAIDVTARSLAEAVSGRLQLWLVEDSVVAPQLFPNNVLEHGYTHRNVLRAAINGDTGTPIVISKQSTKHEHFEIALPQNVVPHNAWVVAFVYNEEGVCQVTRQKVVK